MGYDAEIVRRARARLAAQRAESEQEQVRRTQEVYERFPRVKEIDQALRATVAQVVSAAFRTGEDPQRAVAQAQAENRKLQQERAWILEAAELGEDYLDPIVVCPTCGGTGFVGAEMCQCLQELCQDEQRKALSSLLGVGSERFEKFRLDYYPDQVDPKLGVSPRRVMSIVLEQCRSYAADFSRHSGSLLFSGEPGLGKTYLSACIARQVVSRGFSVCYETAVQIFSDFEQEKFSGADGKTNRYLACDLLIIDDLGTEMTTQFTVSALYTVLNTRLMAHRPTIISTNLAMEGMQRRYSPQIISRIQGAYTCFRFYGNDIRQLVKR